MTPGCVGPPRPPTCVCRSDLRVSISGTERSNSALKEAQSRSHCWKEGLGREKIQVGGKQGRWGWVVS